MNKSDISKLMSEYGKRGAEARKKKYGEGYMKEMSRLGVEARKKKALTK